jgi:hypothetical protein
MILSPSEWTGVPLFAVLNEAGLTAKARYVRAEGNDFGVPPTASKTKAVQDRSTKLGINCLLHLGPQGLFVCIASNIDKLDAAGYYRDQGNDCMVWQG